MATIESDLTAFLAGSTGGHPSQWLQNSASARQLHECALRLLAEAPAAAKKAVLDFYAQVLEHVAGLYFRKKREGREYAEGRRVLDKLKVHLEDLVRTQRRFWGPTVTDWALTLLGSLSSKYSEKVSVSRSLKFKMNVLLISYFNILGFGWIAGFKCFVFTRDFTFVAQLSCHAKPH